MKMLFNWVSPAIEAGSLTEASLLIVPMRTARFISQQAFMRLGKKIMNASPTAHVKNQS